jgi:hypothetical protein
MRKTRFHVGLGIAGKAHNTKQRFIHVINALISINLYAIQFIQIIDYSLVFTFKQ